MCFGIAVGAIKHFKCNDGNVFKLLNNRLIDLQQVPRQAQKLARTFQMHSSLVQRLALDAVMESHHGCVNALAWNAEASMLLSGSDYTRVPVQRLSTSVNGSPSPHFRCHRRRVKKLAINSFKEEQISQRKPHINFPDDEPSIQQLIEGPTMLLSKQGPSRNDTERFILIDGKAVVYRAYFKVMAKLQHGSLEDKSGDGDWVLTVFTALSTVLKVLGLNPSHIVVVFDHEGLTFRHTLFPDYKMNRFPTPDTVVQALRYVKPALLAMGIKTIEIPGVEADDVIGTLAVSAVKAGTKVRIVSPDKDFFQLISTSLRLLRFLPRGSGVVSFGLEEFHARFENLQPSQFVDVLALMGDKVDNIPGVTGIGEKTAVNLIKLYGSLEKLLEERDNVKGKRALNGLLADKGEVLLGKRLVTLRTDLPYYMVPYTLDNFVYKKPQDEGDRYFNLINAMGSFVDGSFIVGIENQTKELWSKY